MVARAFAGLAGIAGWTLAAPQAVLSAMDQAKNLADGDERATIAFSVFSEMIRAADLDDKQRKWAETRWLFEAVWSFTNSLRCDGRHSRITLIATFSSLAVAVAAGIATADSHLGSWARVITLVIGLIGATAVTIDKVMHYGARWRLYRSAYEELAAEGWAFFNSAGQYKEPDREKRFSLFFEKVEKILASRGERYFAEIASLDEPGAHKGS